MLPAVLCFCAITAARGDTSSFPSQITTRDGKTYNSVEKLRVDPDGILVDYQPIPGGYGVAKLKFRDLPDDLQKKYDYDEKKASEYETQQAQCAGQLMVARTADENAVERYRNLAELNQVFGGTDIASFTTTLETNGNVAAQGVTRTESLPSQTVTNVYTGDVPASPYPAYNVLYQRPNLPPGWQQ